MRATIAAFLILVLCPITLASPTIGTMSAEIRKPDKRIDIDRTLDAITKLGVNTYYYLIWQDEHDWDDLPAFAEAAGKRGIAVWPYIVPWSETPPNKKSGWGYSEPFKNDYITWAREIAKLSLKYRNIPGYVIDDFYDNTTEDRFTPNYIRRMTGEAKKINPQIKFYPLMYFQTPWVAFVNRFGSLVDGVVLCYPKSEAGIRNALTYLSDRRHGPTAIIELPRHHGAERGEGGSVSVDVSITDINEAELTFYADATDQVEGDSSLQIGRVRLNSKTIWEAPTDGRQRDGIVSIDLGKYMRRAGKAHLQFDVVTLRTGVPEFLPVICRFDDIRVYGTGNNPTRFPTDLNLKGKTLGKYDLEIMPGSRGGDRPKIPVVLMPTGERESYEKRYDTQGTPQAVADKVGMCLDLLGDELVEGVVCYRTPLNPNGQMFQAVQKEFAAARKSKHRNTGSGE